MRNVIDALSPFLGPQETASGTRPAIGSQVILPMQERLYRYRMYTMLLFAIMLGLIHHKRNTVIVTPSHAMHADLA